MSLPTDQQWMSRCVEDAEFALAARHWSGSLKLQVGDKTIQISFQKGEPSQHLGDHCTTFTGPDAVWSKILCAEPPRFHNDMMANLMQAGGLERQCDPVHFAQYYPAMARAIELLRPASANGGVMSHDQAKADTFATPSGRYVHLELAGQMHRVYFEQAGQGIPILLQHTAGCHGSQWRHLFEIPEITDRFQLIAYDLPYHGKSLPPVPHNWWEEQYLLKGNYLRSIPRALSKALALDKPIFMGCSVGGLLALDLAHKHSDEFRAVISLEGALEIPGELSHSSELWHPQVSNEYKARLMDALMSPTSPKHYRKETSFVYSAGWPPVFYGDLFYYLEEFDLTQTASEIDTNKIAVHILSGEYDCSGTQELGEVAHKAIKGSSHTVMKGMGHFPMSENPKAFLKYLMPVLDQLAN